MRVRNERNHQRSDGDRQGVEVTFAAKEYVRA